MKNKAVVICQAVGLICAATVFFLLVYGKFVPAGCAALLEILIITVTILVFRSRDKAIASQALALTNENVRLQSELDDALTSVRERYIKGILQGELPELDRLDAFLERYNIRFCSDVFSVMSIVIVDESGFYAGGLEHVIDFQDVSRLRKTVIQVFESELQELAQFELVLVDGDLAAILPLKRASGLSEPEIRDHEREYMTELTAAVERAIDRLDREYKLVLLAALSSPFIGVYALNKAYVQALSIAGRENYGRKVLSIYDIDMGATDKKDLIRRSDCERQIYNAVVSHDFKRAGEAMMQRVQMDADNQSVSFARIKCDLSVRLDFLMSTIGVNWYSSSYISNQLMHCFIGIQESTSPDELNSRVMDFCNKLQDYWSSQTQDAINRAEDIMDYIQENFADQNLSATMICENFGISQAYLSRMFKQKTGVGVLEYIHRVRIAEVKRLLGEGLTLQDIALQVGYFSRRTLTQAFKRYEGITPDVWRKTFVNNNSPKQ